MNYNISRYLNVIDLGGSVLLFNGVNSCMDEVSGQPAEAFRSGSAQSVNALCSEELETLLKRGHITTLSPDEELGRFKEFVSVMHGNMGKDDRGGGIMLLMSYNCNLACKYCYQQEHRPHKSRAVMSEAMVETIFEKQFSNIIKGAQQSFSNISFYGGEPFLPSNEAVIRKTLGYAKKYGMQSTAISNATMVDLMPDIFGDGPGFVSRVQVSLDGSKELHDKSRVPLGGEPTYDKILKNIRMMVERKTQVSIRLNLDKRTMESVPRLIKDLKDSGILGSKYVNIYASPLHDNIAKVDATDFVDMADLSSKVFDLGIDLEHPVSMRANEISHLFKLKRGFGLTRTCFCMQTRQRSVVVDPFGDIYGCFEEAGYPQYRVGHLSESGVEFFPLHETYKTRHIANLEECAKCSVALACGGQCGVKSRTKTGDLFKPACDDTKRVIIESIKLAYQNRNRPADSAAADKEPDLLSTHG